MYGFFNLGNIHGRIVASCGRVVNMANELTAILSMAADHTKNRLKAGLPRHVVPPSGGNASTLIRQLDGRKKRKMPKEKKF